MHRINLKSTFIRIKYLTFDGKQHVDKQSSQHESNIKFEP